MALVKTYMKLKPILLLRNNIKLCTRAKHKETRDYQYLWQASNKVPKTPEEIKEVAEKYNLHPSEYKPYGPDECYGDYPQLPLIGVAARDPYYPWDFPSIRRNFCEPLHMYEDQIGEDRHDAGIKEYFSYGEAWILFCGTFLIYGIFSYIGEMYSWFQPVLEKQYPRAGVTHYTFEPLH